MALSTEHKLYIGLGVVALLGAGIYVQNQQKAEEAKTYSASAAKAELPKIELTEEKTKELDKIDITVPGDEKATDAEKKKPSHVVLEKKGDEWRLTTPVQAKASESNVKQLLSSLEKLEVKELIAAGTDSYEKLGVADAKAIHAVFFKKGEKLGEFWFGETAGRGTMTRIAGRDGVFGVDGYSSFNFKRDARGWRDREIFKFDDAKAKSVEIVNENGTFTFAKDKDGWSAKFKAPKALAAKALERFDSKKVEDLLRAFKGLNADNFGDDKKAADVGLDAPVASLTITLDDGAQRIVRVGAKSEGESRWAVQGTSDQIFSITSWPAGWILAKEDKFQKPADAKKDDAKKDDADDAPDPGMPDEE
jgi:hypothetical protein